MTTPTGAPLVQQAVTAVLEEPLPMRLTAYDGTDVGPKDAAIQLRIENEEGLRYLLTAPGDLGLARAYLTGTLTGTGFSEGDPYEVFSLIKRDLRVKDLGKRDAASVLAPIVKTLGAKALKHPPLPEIENQPRWKRHLAKVNPMSRAADSISYHYDVSNAFYEKVLGPSMAYTCAVYDAATDSLEEAQERKFALVADKLDLQPGDRLLDVGCGWGGMAIHAARRRESLLRLSFGAFLVLVGLVTAAATGRGFAGLRDVGIALVVLLGGLAAVLAPFGLRLWDDMRRDQAERAMADARADVASHLHDSVLQTLALIQRRTNEPEIAQLARTQERDLRSWLFADDENAPEVADAPELLRGVVHAVEDGFAVPVDVIVTGQAPVTPRIEALVSAVREATTNAAKHGAPPVSVYAEFNADVAEVFVRDHGEGFDPDAVAEDRAGVRESIVGRMERHGGSARIRRLDDGLEVSLTMPLEERS